MVPGLWRIQQKWKIRDPAFKEQTTQEKTRMNTHKTTRDLQKAADRKGQIWLLQLSVPQAVWEWRDQHGWEKWERIPGRASIGTTSSCSKANHRNYYWWNIYFVSGTLRDLHAVKQPTCLTTTQGRRHFYCSQGTNKETEAQKSEVICHTPFTMSMNFRVSG